MSAEELDYFIDRFNVLLVQDLELNNLASEVEENLPEEQIALLLEAFPISLRLTIWQALSATLQQSVFLEMKTESRKLLLKHLSDEQCYPLFERIDAASLMELASDLADRFIDYAVSKMTKRQREFFKKAQDYAEDEIGHWQSFDDLRIPNTLSVSAAKKVCAKKLPLLTEVIYVVDQDVKLIGEVAIADLLKAHDGSLITTLLSEEFDMIAADTPTFEAVDRVVMSGKAALPVIDENGCLTGRVDLASAYQFKEEENNMQFIQSGGLVKEEDLFSSVWKSSKNRAIWLGINLITAFLASWCIALFDTTLEQVVALAVLMPIVASMGGISGSQTLTLIIRGLALGQITDSNKIAILQKELKIAAINGLLWAVVISYITYLWFDNGLLSLTIFIAILGNILIAAFSGVWIPWLLDKMNIDPALSGSVILTTVTDVFGFITFLGLGSLLLH